MKAHDIGNSAGHGKGSAVLPFLRHIGLLAIIKKAIPDYIFERPLRYITGVGVTNIGTSAKIKTLGVVFFLYEPGRTAASKKL